MISVWCRLMMSASVVLFASYAAQSETWMEKRERDWKTKEILETAGQVQAIVDACGFEVRDKDTARLLEEAYETFAPSSVEFAIYSDALNEMFNHISNEIAEKGFDEACTAVKKPFGKKLK